MADKNKNIKILLVDDDEFLLDMYAVKFRNSGFGVEVARGSEEALTKLKSGYSPDVLLLDLVMPQISGFEFLEMAKKQKLLSGCFVIILSNLGQKEDLERGKKLGVDDYVVKANFTPSEVVKKVIDVLGVTPGEVAEKIDISTKNKK